MTQDEGVEVPRPSSTRLDGLSDRPAIMVAVGIIIPAYPSGIPDVLAAHEPYVRERLRADPHVGVGGARRRS